MFRRWAEAFIRPGPRHERWIYPHTFPYYGTLVTPAADPDAPIRLRFALKDADLHSLRFR